MTTRSIGIGVAAVVILAVAFYFAVWSPLDDQETALNTETQTLQQQEQQLRNQLVQLQLIKEDELRIRADLNRLRELIPSGDPAQPSLVRALQLAADASGTEISALAFGDPVVVEGAVPDSEGLVLSEIDLTADLTGGYFQIMDLFRRVEIEVVRAVQVDSFTLNESGDGFPELGASITGRVFALLPTAVVEELPDAAATPAPEGSPAPEGGEGTESATPATETEPEAAVAQ